MKAFELQHPQTVAQASRLLSDPKMSARPMAGGQDLLTLMKDYIVSPDRVVDLKRIPGLDQIDYDPKHGLRIGALATITDVEENPQIRKYFPILAEAAGSVASIQIRNVGTVGGNLCQRPRCWYFRNELVHCLKKGGSKCYAADDDAENKYHAIFGAGPCHIVHPSDLAPALTCLGAVIHISGVDGARDVPISDFYILPENGGIAHETVLKPGEIVTSITVPQTSWANRSVYLKCREKESFDWALASVAMAVTTVGGTIKEAHVVLGGVAPVPWRATSVEAALRGHSIASDAAIASAAAAIAADAAPLSKNGYKVTLAQALIRRAAGILRAGPRNAFTPEEALWQV
jgi:xanthine dehydrogenase YagS FAD-binding subunit